jgi:hypothetical protein
MGKIILKNNGLETQIVNGVNFSSLTPENDVFYFGVDALSGELQKSDPNGEIIELKKNGGVVTTTYSGLVSDILTSGLTTGSFYLITDFQTCYDQPDYDYDNTINLNRFYRNDIGNEFFNNTLNDNGGSDFHNNEIGNRFNNNTTAGGINTTAYLGSTSNVFTFDITNNSGSPQIVYYGYVKIS